MFRLSIRHSSLITRHSPLLLELAAILLIELLYISLITPPVRMAPTVTDHIDTTPLEHTLFDPAIRQTGLEHERLAGVLLPIKLGLDRYGHIPTWNPYMTIGEPTINNAFNYLFNPFHSLPILLLGGVEGSKLATFIALLIAGYSMWALAQALGLGAVARVTTAALYMMSGSIMGKFYIGHFQLALSLAWPPLVFATLWWTLHSRARFAPVAFGLAFALLFFAGNIYYVLHTLLCIALIVLIHLVERIPASSLTDRSISLLYLPGRRLWGSINWRIRWDRLGRVILAGVFAFGLAALQFFPVWQTRDYVNHPEQIVNDDGSLQGSYSMAQAVANLTYPWPDWLTFESLSTAPLVAVDYAYIGAAPFLLIALAFILFSARASRVHYSSLSTQHIALFLVLALLMMIWGAGQTPLLQWLYTHISLLAEFRFLGRALAIAALWWIVLAGISLDLLWKTARNAFNAPTAFAAYDRVRLLRAMGIATLLWGYWFIYSIANPSTRQVMVLYNFRALNTFDEHRFTSFSQAVNAFWSFLLIAVVIDSLLVVVERWLRPRFAQKNGVGWRAWATRVSHVFLLGVAVAAILDIMMVNSRLFDFQMVGPRFTAIYDDIKRMDSNPFPSVNDSFSPLAFDNYEQGVRTWGLNEGWRPWLPVGGVIPTLETLTDLPRWAIVSNAYSGAAQEFAQAFVDNYGYTLKQCYPILSTGGTSDDPCLMDSQHTGAVLYEKTDTLPYAFAVPDERLLHDPASLNATNVFPVEIISHEMDTITIQATTPGDSTRLNYYLIVGETNFPGWQAYVDGVPAQVSTVQTAYDGIHNRGFLAVPMPSGAHTYILRFEPPGFATGLLLFVITLIGIIVYLLRPIRKNRLSSTPGQASP